jgi:hypothetical protein
MREIERVEFALASSELRAGGLLEGTVTVHADRPVPGLELSVLWITSGKGEVDEGVIHYEKLADDVRADEPVTLDVRLPLTPTSFAGEHLTITWMVRVRERSGTTWDQRFTVRP